MEEIFRPEGPPASADLSAAEDCGNELTRTNSDSSSITRADSMDLTDRNANARPHTGCTAWTDEKHNAHLDSLEASFVKQLHHSLGLFSCHSEQNICGIPSRRMPVYASYASNQLQEGSRQTSKCGSDQLLPHNPADSRVIGTQQRSYFRCLGKHGSESGTLTSADQQKYSMFCCKGMPLRGEGPFPYKLTNSGWPSVCRQDATGTISEVSDQNFVDEEEREGRSNSFSRPKRWKMAATEDQIVPSGNILEEKTSTSNGTL